MPRSWMIPLRFRQAHLADLPVRVSGHLPPFPLWTAFPPSEYYGGSVALRLAARRGSHLPKVLDVSSAT